jgi:hypothetical protein
MATKRHQNPRLGRPRTGRGDAITVRMKADLSKAIASYIRKCPAPKPSRSEAIRDLIKFGLTATGLHSR